MLLLIIGWLLDPDGFETIGFERTVSLMVTTSAPTIRPFGDLRTFYGDVAVGQCEVVFIAVPFLPGFRGVTRSTECEG